MRKTLFLDRDGIINVDVHYLHRIEDMRFIQGAIKALKVAVEAGYQLIVITNQSGVARGYYTEDDVQTLHRYMGEQLAATGAPITAFYYCPHHEKGVVPAYTKSCECRKPRPGLVLQAVREHQVDVAHSFMIGDKPSDVATAEAAGMDGYLFEGIDLADFLLPILAKRGYDESV